MRNPYDPYDDRDDYPDPNEPSTNEGGPSGGTPSTLVGYDEMGNPIYADNTGAQFTFRSADGTWLPYTGEASPTQTWVTPPAPQQPGGPDPSLPTGPPTPPGPSGGGAAPPATEFPGFNEPWAPPPQTPLPTAPEFKPPEYTPPDPFSYDDYKAPDPFAYDEYKAPDAFSYDAYKAPDPFSFADFVAPSAESALKDPGYQFRTQQGQAQLERSAAARGVINTGMNLKDILDYGQNAASQEYQNVWNRDLGAYATNRAGAFDTYKTNAATGANAYTTNRNNAFQNYVTNAETGFKAYGTNRANALDTYNTNELNRFNTYTTNRAGAVDTYNTNYKTQYYDPYQIAYKGAYDTFGGNMDAWKTNAGFTERNNQFNTDTAYQKWVQDAQNYYREQENRWGRARDVYTA